MQCARKTWTRDGSRIPKRTTVQVPLMAVEQVLHPRDSGQLGMPAEALRAAHTQILRENPFRLTWSIAKQFSRDHVQARGACKARLS